MERAIVTRKAERLKTAGEYLQSGKTIQAWSQEKQINRYTLTNWLEEYKRETKNNSKNHDWLEVPVADELMDLSVKPVQINYQTQPIRIKIGEVEIEVAAGFDEATLTAVLKAVRRQ